MFHDREQIGQVNGSLPVQIADFIGLKNHKTRALCRISEHTPVPLRAGALGDLFGLF
jgi:hypothetical protein